MWVGEPWGWRCHNFGNLRNLRRGDLKLTSLSPLLLLVKLCVCFQGEYSIFISGFKERKKKRTRKEGSKSIGRAVKEG